VTRDAGGLRWLRFDPYFDHRIGFRCPKKAAMALAVPMMGRRGCAVSPAVLLSLAIVVAACATTANATSAGDATITLGGGTGGGASAISVASFSIVSPSGSSPATSPCILIQGATQTPSPLCLFENAESAGEQITSLSLDETSVAFGTHEGSCGVLVGSLLSKCNVFALPLGGFQYVFFGGAIPFHTDFTLDFADFPLHQTFAVTATISSAPEPDTLILLICGLGPLLMLSGWRVHFQVSLLSKRLN
jgi:hypothetical protein